MEDSLQLMIKNRVHLNEQVMRYALLSYRFAAFDSALSQELQKVSTRKSVHLHNLNQFYLSYFNGPKESLLSKLEADVCSNEEHFLVISKEMGRCLLADALSRELSLQLEYQEASLKESDPTVQEFWQSFAKLGDSDYYDVKNLLSRFENRNEPAPHDNDAAFRPGLSRTSRLSQLPA